MPTYPYLYKRINFGRLFNPLVLLPVKASWGWQALWFLVDSGADALMLPVALAKRLKLPFDSSVKIKLYGIGEQALYASPGEVVLKIGDRETKARSFFVYSRDSALLLGRLDVFEQFSITFDKEKQSVIFRE